MQEKISRGINVCVNTCGPVFVLVRIQEHIFEGSFSVYLPNSRGTSFRCEYMSRLYPHPRGGVEKLTRSSLKGVSNKSLFACKNGHFASSFLLLGIGFLEASKQANLSFKRPSLEPRLDRTGSVFALSSIGFAPGGIA